MSLPVFDAAWLEGLREQAVQPPRAPRQPLFLGAARIGSIAPVLAERLGGEAALRRCGLDRAGSGAAARWTLQRDPDTVFQRLGGAVRAAGLAPVWRDEPLPVRDDDGRTLTRAPRGLARLLGLCTFSVTLIGLVEGGGTWVQRRALDKAEDPGQWDMLMSGTVGAGESVDDTLARETWEEAGLRVAALRALRPCGTVRLDRPQGPEGERGLRHQVERIDCFVATLAPGSHPVNRDGEVIAFECLAPDALSARLRAGAFTLEASLALALAAPG